MNDEIHNADTQKLVDELLDSYKQKSNVNFIDEENLPARDNILTILDLLFELLFPGYTGRRTVTRNSVRYVIGDILCLVRTELIDQLERAFRHDCRIRNCDEKDCDCRERAEEVTSILLSRLVEIRDVLNTDIQAAFDGDPAARSLEEVVISYPAIIAITTHRIAHELYKLEVPLVPRIMSEAAHTRTGIDIHPGATIDERFFIDHGTGVVIGETATIGRNVKIYQGVTLGALSFPKDERGIVVKGGKRHPTIEDDVTIYAEATILGDITIGSGTIVGGNAWITRSIPPNVTVAMEKPITRVKHHFGFSPEHYKGANI